MKKVIFALTNVVVSVLNSLDYFILLIIFPFAYNDKLQYKFRTVFGRWAMALEINQIAEILGVDDD